MIKPVTNKEIKRILQNFKNNKSPGENKIDKILLLQLPDNMIARYRKRINSTISMGYFPILLKNGIIVLTTKSDKDSWYPINYRHITLLGVPGKVLEKLINNRLWEFCETNNIYNKDQYGFRASRGTDISISKIYETIAINQ